MNSFADVISLPVILQKSGKKIGTVFDFSLHDQSFELAHLIYQKKSIYQKKLQVSVSFIQHCESDTLVVSHDTLEESKNFTSLYTATQLLYKRVCTPQGKEIGMVSDLILDFDKREIIYLEVSDGLINDVKNGRKMLPLIGKNIYENDFLIVDQEVIDEIN